MLLEMEVPKRISGIFHRDLNLPTFPRRHRKRSKVSKRPKISVTSFITSSGSVSSSGSKSSLEVKSPVSSTNSTPLTSRRESAPETPSDKEQDEFFDIMFKLQGSRLDDQRITMPAFLTKHQQLKMDIRPPEVEDDEDDPLKKILERGAPYPMVVLPATGAYWVEGDNHMVSRDNNNRPQFPTIDMSKVAITENTTGYNYRKSFVGKEHMNFAGIDGKHGEVLLSVLLKKATREGEDDVYKVILRVKEKNICEIVKASVFGDEQPGPRDFMKLLLGESEVDVSHFHPVASLTAGEKITSFDEHHISNSSKVGVIYQKFAQVNENEYLRNQDDSLAFREFLDMLGTRVQLKNFQKYRGGLDTKDGHTGTESYYTAFQNKEIMFHVSTLLPVCHDTHNIDRKRHIGNDVVSIIFQDKNTPFTPNIRSHFLHVFIVVQVEESNSENTYYKVSVTGKDIVPKFSPYLPSPSIFKKGPEFRDFLLTKILNAEIASYKSEDFAKLLGRTRSVLFARLVNNFIAENEKLLIDEEAASATSMEETKNSGLFSSFRSALRRNSRADAYATAEVDEGSLRSCKMSGQSLSLNDISYINPEKKVATVKKTSSKERKENEKKKVKKDKFSPTLLRNNPSPAQLDRLPRSPIPSPLTTTIPSPHTTTRRSFTNELFDSTITATSVTIIKTSEETHSKQTHQTSKENEEEMRNLKEENERLRIEVSDLQRQNNAIQSQKMFETMATPNGITTKRSVRRPPGKPHISCSPTEYV